MLHTTWTFHCEVDTVETIIPDGCRDIIVVHHADSPDIIFLSDLDICPRRMLAKSGRRMTGHRLRPGFQIEHADLLELAKNRKFAISSIETAITSDTEIADLTEALAYADTSIAKTARSAGVSERTLLRKFRQAGLPKPAFWQMLGRARRAATALTAETSLADLALSAGYSDQAHMTREFKRWFGRSPAQFLRSESLRNQVLQPGLGNWTGEHISIK